MGRQAGRGKRHAEAQDARRRRVRAVLARAAKVPPPESEFWPEQCRGKRWKPVFAILFAGRCQLCVYACQAPKSRQLMNKWLRQDTRLLCTNQPGSPGGLQEVRPTESCRNFRMKRWKVPASQQVKPGSGRRRRTCGSEADAEIRRIPLSRGLFAIVDAADYEELSKYKWSASKRGRNPYAITRINGKCVAMHRMIMKPPPGKTVDHIDQNASNNRRSNLRVCTHRQNQANRGPRGGARRFVGVSRCGKKWVAEIMHRGKCYYLGLYASEIEAAKARDRKAYELNHEYAFVNLPEELKRWLRQRRRRGLAPAQSKGSSRRKHKAFARAGRRKPKES